MWFQQVFLRESHYVWSGKIVMFNKDKVLTFSCLTWKRLISIFSGILRLESISTRLPPSHFFQFSLRKEFGNFGEISAARGPKSQFEVERWLKSSPSKTKAPFWFAPRKIPPGGTFLRPWCIPRHFYPNTVGIRLVSRFFVNIFNHLNFTEEN